jgi:hypothetical protein
MPSKHELIDRIRQINRSADTRWLEAFDQSALFNYFEHLQVLMEPRGRSSVWRRRPETPAVVARNE